MSLPIIAIIGRPNVGKSRLFNRLTGKFKALVDGQPGVTRDRHYGLCEWRDRSFMIVDTGGLIPGAEEVLNQKVWQQAFLAIQEADVLICVLDAQTGLTVADEALVKQLRKISKPVFYAVNKIDEAAHENNIVDFTRLGLDPLIPISAEHGRGISDLLEAIIPQMEICTSVRAYERTNVPTYERTSVPTYERTSVRAYEHTNALKVAIVGRPNVGKSTLVNKLAGEARVIVHEEAGTTRDAIDIAITRGKQHFVLVDTAGIKRKSATRTRLEKFSVMGSLKAIARSQIVCLVLEAQQGITHQDLQLAYHIWEAKKGLLILVNKWDLMKCSTKIYLKDFFPQLKALQDCPVLCISATMGLNCEKLWDEVLTIHEAMQKRLTTAKLNQWLEKAQQLHSLPMVQGKTVKLYYGTQVDTDPPHIILFANRPKNISEGYRRYLVSSLQKEMGIEGIPIDLTFRLKK